MIGGENFTVVHKTPYSLENCCGADHQGHYVPYTASDSCGKLSRLARKNHKAFPLETFTLYGISKLQYRMMNFMLVYIRKMVSSLDSMLSYHCSNFVT